MKDYIVSSIRWALSGVDENDQNIFENYKIREEVKCDVTNIRQNEEAERDSEINVEGEKLSGYINNDQSGENSGAEGSNNELEGKQTEIVEEFRRDRKLVILTDTGKRFVNTMLDHCVCKKAIDLNLTGNYCINSFKYPDIKLFKIVNLSRRTYFNTDAEIFDDSNERMIFKYPFLADQDNDVEWEYIDGEAEVMDPDEFNRTWRRIIRVSKRLDDSININKEITKPIVHWDKLTCAYNKNDELCVRFDASPSQDDLIFTAITQPYWRFDEKPFAKVKTESNYSQLDIQEWLMSKDKSNSNNSNSNRSNNSNNRQKNVSKNKNKSNGQQPVNDSKANALNPNQQQ